MTRNGPVGQGRAPLRRGPAEHDPYANGQNGQWPQQQGGYSDPQYNGGPQQAYNGNGGHPGYNGNGAQNGQFHYPQAPEPDPQYYQQQAGYQQQAQWGPGQQDPRNYDLGNYGGGPQGGFAPPEPMQHYQPEPAPSFAGGHQQSYAEPEGDYDDVLAEDDDEPHSGRRWIVIVAALVGAICLGGGLAYTYKMLFTSNSGRSPIAKAVDFPNKPKAATGGKETAAPDKKLFTRLGDDGPAAAKPDSDAEATEDKPADTGVGGPRPVRIIPIAPGSGSGQVSTTTGGSVAPTKPPGSQIVVPGLFVDTPGPRAPMQQAGPQAGLDPAGAARKPPERAPVIIPTNPSTATGGTNPSTATGATSPTTAAKVPVPKTKEASAATSATNATTPVSSEFVAVVSSQKSRMDAMKAYASMDQKYRDMLASSTFDVQEADLGEKGVWYRAVVGPPRSFEGAKKICDDLKSAGYPSCWPARY